MEPGGILAGLVLGDKVKTSDEDHRVEELAGFDGGHDIALDDKVAVFWCQVYGEGVCPDAFMCADRVILSAF